MKIGEFKGGPSWCFDLCDAKALQYSRTTVGQKLPEGWQEKLDTFREYTNKIIREHKIGYDELMNIDGISLTFDIPMTRTAEKKGEKTVPIKTTSHESLALRWC